MLRRSEFLVDVQVFSLAYKWNARVLWPFWLLLQGGHNRRYFIEQLVYRSASGVCLKSQDRPDWLLLLRWLGTLSHIHPQDGRYLREEENLLVLYGSLALYFPGPLRLKRPEPDHCANVHLRHCGSRQVFNKLPLPHGAPPDIKAGFRGHNSSCE